MTTASRAVVVALGSNLGDRLGLLQGAVDGLAATPGVRVVAVSGVYETDPVGGPDQPDYLNAVALLDTGLSAPDLLRRALDLEAAAGRERRERWGPRTLDVDLVRCGDEVRHANQLTLPHPRAASRAFVLLPWIDVDPDAVLPEGRVADLLSALDLAGVRHRPDLVLHP